LDAPNFLQRALVRTGSWVFARDDKSFMDVSTSSGRINNPKEKTRSHDAIGFFVGRVQVGKTGLANTNLSVSSGAL
jgi:hypothetical protein